MSTETAIRERPILFSASMVRAILEGRKTQTRRVMKPQPRPGRYGATHPTMPSGIIGPVPGALGGGDYHVWEGKHATACLTDTGDYVAIRQCPHGQPGERLWCRETWQAHERPKDGVDGILFAADGTFRPIENTREAAERWMEAAHRKPSKAEFSVVSPGVSVATCRKRTGWQPSIFMPRWASRITLEITEVGIERLLSISEADKLAEGATPEVPFGTVWRKLNTKPGIRWEDDPWVWAISFRRLGTTS